MIPLEDTHPFVTISLFQKATASKTASETFAKLDALALTLKTVPCQYGKGYINGFGAFEAQEREVLGAWYRIDKPPAWLGLEEQEESDEQETSNEDKVQKPKAKRSDADTLLDQEHHLVLLITKGNLLAMLATQEPMRIRLAQLIGNGAYSSEEQE